jgi:hypothetical protein
LPPSACCPSTQWRVGHGLWTRWGSWRSSHSCPRSAPSSRTTAESTTLLLVRLCPRQSKSSLSRNVHTCKAYTELALSICSLAHPGVWSPLSVAHSHSPPGERVGVEERDVVTTWWCHVPRVDVATCSSVATTMRALAKKFSASHELRELWPACRDVGRALGCTRRDGALCESRCLSIACHVALLTARCWLSVSRHQHHHTNSASLW